MDQACEFLPLDQVRHVIIHHPCCDGTGSEWAILETLSRKNGKADTKVPRFLGYDHNKEQARSILKQLSAAPDEEVGGILMVDVCWTPRRLRRLCRVVTKVLVLDHHVTAKRLLESEPLPLPDNLHVMFDISRCGCTLAWEYAQRSLFGSLRSPDPLPNFLSYIEDRDLWRQAEADSKNFTTALYKEPLPPLGQSPTQWDRFLEPREVTRMIEIGARQSVMDGQLIDRAIASARDFWFDREEFYLPVCVCLIEIRDSPSLLPLVSDIGHWALRRKPTRDVAVMWRAVRPSSPSSRAALSSSPDAPKKKYRYSFRSTDKSLFTARQLAELFDGGGHEHAAGLCSDLSPFQLFQSFQISDYPRDREQSFSSLSPSSPPFQPS